MCDSSANADLLHEQMLKLPRRPPSTKLSRLHRAARQIATPSLTHYSALTLAKHTKLSWAQFEAIRLKIARALTAKTSVSRRTWFKQKRKQKSKRVIGQKIKLTTAWYAGFPHTPYFAKGRGSRMGKGKGNLKYWYFWGRAGNPILMIRHKNYTLIKHTLHKICQLAPSLKLTRAKNDHRWLQQDEVLE